MFCRSCGSTVNSGDKFCGSCGTAVEQEEPPSIITKNSPQISICKNDIPTPWGNTFWLCKSTGIVEDYNVKTTQSLETSHRVETHTMTGFAGGKLAFGSVDVPVTDYSLKTNETITFWLRYQDGSKEHYEFHDTNIPPMQNGHTVTVCWGANSGTTTGKIKYVYNHITNSGEFVAASFSDLGVLYAATQDGAKNVFTVIGGIIGFFIIVGTLADIFHAENFAGLMFLIAFIVFMMLVIIMFYIVKRNKLIAKMSLYIKPIILQLISDEKKFEDVVSNLMQKTRRFSIKRSSWEELIQGFIVGLLKG